MKRSSYRDQDRVFGQLMLTLRTAIGLTQAGLADVLGVSRHAVGGWETGQSYPKADHLRQLIELGIAQHAFAAGHELEEIRALWRAARQKVLLDEHWLQELLNRPTSPLMPAPAEQTDTVAATNAPFAERAPQVDWSDALDIPSLYGRAGDLALLARWVTVDRCRVVSVLGMGGIGKSALAVAAMRQVATQFEVVIWRSVRDAPACEALLEACLQVLAPQSLPATPATLEGRLQLLMEQLRERRVLLVLDNLEALLEEGIGTGHMRAGAEGYASMLRRIAETGHHSCLLLTSREKPAELVSPEGSNSSVRAVRLAGIEAGAGAQLLVECDVAGTALERERLAEMYGGNPLALKIVARTIVDLFRGDIKPFLAQGEVIFGGVRQLLDDQFDRLSALERAVFYWLTILREPVRLEEIGAHFNTPVAPAHLLEGLAGLRRRSLIERGQAAGSFTLQSVVLEYATERLIAAASREIEQGRLECLVEYGLCHAQAKDYVRATQEYLLVVPLLNRLQHMYGGRAVVEERLRWLLTQLRGVPQLAQGYGPANLVTLLRLLRGDLRGLDLSRLLLRGVYLQGVQMQETLLTAAVIRASVFTETFDAIWAVAISRTGRYWAAGSKRGELRVWREDGRSLHLAWPAHPDFVWKLVFSPDERTLASGSPDGSIRLWDVANGGLLWAGWHTKGTTGLAFSPDGDLLASTGVDATIRIWDIGRGTLFEELPHPVPIFALAWSPRERLLASGDVTGTVRLWQLQATGPARCVQTVVEHATMVRSLSFAPDGRQFASGGWDGTIKICDTESGHCQQTLVGHTGQVQALAWSPNGATLASGGYDNTIRLWNCQTGTSRLVLQGHSAMVYGLAFTPDSRSLLSGGDDGTLQLWDVQGGQCMRALQGYSSSLYDIAWKPDATHLASAGPDNLVALWDVAHEMKPKVLAEHRFTVYGVGWSPDGRMLASSGWDSTIRLWDAATATNIQVLRDRENSDTIFYGLAWSPDGHLLASGTFLQGVPVWDMATHALQWVGRVQATWIRRVAWSPDSRRLIGGGDDGHIYMWEAADGTLLKQLMGHHGVVTSLVWSPDGKWLASGGSNQEHGDVGELIVWAADSGERVRTWSEHPGVASAVDWSPSGELLISGSSDGMLRWWDAASGRCVRTRQGHQGTVQALRRSPDGTRIASCGDDGAIVLWDLRTGAHIQTLRRDRPYERLDITGIQGLTDAQTASLRALGAFEETSRSAAKE